MMSTSELYFGDMSPTKELARLDKKGGCFNAVLCPKSLAPQLIEWDG